MFQRLKEMLIKEFLQIMRDPRMRGVVFASPVVQMMVIAFALTTDVKLIETGLLDEDHTPASRDFIANLTASGHFQITARAQSPADFHTLLDHGAIRAAFHVPAGFEADLRAGRTAKIQLLADGTLSNDVSIVFGYASQILRQFNAREQNRRLAASLPFGRAPAQVEFQSLAWFNPNLESKYYYAPALIAVMLMVISLMLTSIAIVREKEIGTIEQIMVTPIRRTEFILGKTIPYLLISYVLMTLMLIVAVLVFDIRIRGSLVLLYATAGIYILGNLGLALFVSVSARTQQQALLTAFFIMMPGVLLSGFMFPIRNMPIEIQWITLANPMRWFLEILRGVTMKGLGLAELWPAALAQTVLAVVFFALATARFRKTLS